MLRTSCRFLLLLLCPVCNKGVRFSVKTEIVDGKEVVMQVKEGQKVIYSKYAGTEVKLEGQQYIIVRQNDILAIVED